LARLIAIIEPREEETFEISISKEQNIFVMTELFLSKVGEE